MIFKMSYIRYNIKSFEDDYVVKMRLSTLDILEDWLYEWDVMKSLLKIVKKIK